MYPLSFQSVCKVGKQVAVQKVYLFRCSQMLHPNRLIVSKMMPQNVRDHVCYTEAEIKSFHPVAYVFIKDRWWMWMWVCGCVEVYLLVYLDVCISDRHRHIATPTNQHHASTVTTHPHPHSTSTHLTNNVQTCLHHKIFRNFTFIHFFMLKHKLI